MAATAHNTRVGVLPTQIQHALSSGAGDSADHTANSEWNARWHRTISAIKRSDELMCYAANLEDELEAPEEPSGLPEIPPDLVIKDTRRQETYVLDTADKINLLIQDPNDRDSRLYMLELWQAETEDARKQMTAPWVAYEAAKAAAAKADEIGEAAWRDAVQEIAEALDTPAQTMIGFVDKIWLAIYSHTLRQFEGPKVLNELVTEGRRLALSYHPNAAGDERDYPRLDP